jgi:hypothetical protein
MTQPVHDPAQVRLGKLAPRLDRRTLRFAAYVTSDLPVPPVELDLHAGTTAWGMLGNDVWGDCTCAAYGHTVQAWTEAAVGHMADVTADQVLAAYHVISPDDQGAYCLDALNYFRKAGIGGHKLGAYAKVQPTARQHMQASAWLFGTVYLGLSLSVEQQRQDVWNYVPDSMPGDWGGHAVNIVGYNAVGPVVVTWGERKQTTWSFIDKQCDEAYALIGPEWFGPGGLSPSGFDLAALSADLHAIGGGDPINPGPTPPDPGGGDVPFWIRILRWLLGWTGLWPASTSPPGRSG